MILVDSSVWIDYFRGAPTAAAATLHDLVGDRGLAVGDLVLAEVLQGFASERDFARGLSLMSSFPLLEIGGRDIAIAAAGAYRSLRARGVTVRGTIDTLIATRCIRDGHQLLYGDRDFDPFVEHLGLMAAMRLN